MKYSIVTFGCRVNQADSLAIEERLRARGGCEAPACAADLIVVNTCSVTASADQGARQRIRRIARENPGAEIVVTGCYATRRPDEIAALPNVVRVVTNAEKDRLFARDVSGDTPDLTVGPTGTCAAPVGIALGSDTMRPASTSGVGPTLRSGVGVPTAERFGEGDGPCGLPIEPGFAGRTAFTLRVQTGCEERCSYCIIPSTRGAGRSVPVDRVVAEVRRIAACGFREIALTGVHLGSYGRDLDARRSLLDLLRALADVPEDVSFRISSLEPMDCTRDMVAFIASSGGRFAPHFHLPLQHASDRMLTLMRRPYTLEYYRRLVDAIVERLPHASIGTDMIVGFPGEREADFAANLEYLPGSPLSHVHVFPYSDRPGTAAAGMPDKVEGAVVRERGARLRAIGTELSRRFRRSQEGSVRPGLTLEDGAVLVTDNYLKVRIGNGHSRNERLFVRILSSTEAEVADPVWRAHPISGARTS
jgi:threonylcarbamoyladenosine tRNA methylthiotransferase MtaB